jgi:hypothetical protein
VINEGGVCDDALLKDYYGGLLTAAKSNEADDRAVPYFAVLEGLSTDQVTAHFIIYARIHQSPTGIQSITYQEHRQRAFVILPITKLMSRLGRDGDHQPVVTHVVTGLLRSGLIDPFYQYGTPEYIESKIPGLTVDEPVLVVVPSVLGVELFLWAAGERDKGPDYILNAEAKLMDRFPYSP